MSQYTRYPARGGITQLTGDVTAGPGSGSQVATIANGVVTNAKLATMPAFTIKGNNTASMDVPLDLTVSQVNTMLAVANNTLSNLVSPTAINQNLLFGSDGTNNIGTASSGRPQDVYFRNSLTIGQLGDIDPFGNTLVIGETGSICGLTDQTYDIGSRQSGLVPLRPITISSGSALYLGLLNIPTSPGFVLGGDIGTGNPVAFIAWETDGGGDIGNYWNGPLARPRDIRASRDIYSSNSFIVDSNVAQVSTVGQVSIAAVAAVSDGTKVIAIGSESTVVASVAPVADNKLKVNINGVEFYILLQAV